MSYRVTAPYVTVPVRDDAGVETVHGFYVDAVLPPAAVKENVELLRVKGMVEKVKDAPAPKAPTTEGTVPTGRASRDDWAAYATSKGAPEEETRPVDEGGLSRDDLRAKYGG